MNFCGCQTTTGTHSIALVAQARGAGLTLVTADDNIARYDVAQLNARA